MVEEGCVLGGCGLQVLSGDRSSVSKQWFNMLLKPELKAALALSGFPAVTPLVHLVYPIPHSPHSESTGSGPPTHERRQRLRVREKR